MTLKKDSVVGEQAHMDVRRLRFRSAQQQHTRQWLAGILEQDWPDYPAYSSENFGREYHDLDIDPFEGDGPWQFVAEIDSVESAVALKNDQRRKVDWDFVRQASVDLFEEEQYSFVQDDKLYRPYRDWTIDDIPVVYAEDVLPGYLDSFSLALYNTFGQMSDVQRYFERHGGFGESDQQDVVLAQRRSRPQYGDEQIVTIGKFFVESGALEEVVDLHRGENIKSAADVVDAYFHARLPRTYANTIFRLLKTGQYGGHDEAVEALKRRYGDDFDAVVVAYVINDAYEEFKQDIRGGEMQETWTDWAYEKADEINAANFKKEIARVFEVSPAADWSTDFKREAIASLLNGSVSVEELGKIVGFLNDDEWGRVPDAIREIVDLGNFAEPASEGGRYFLIQSSPFDVSATGQYGSVVGSLYELYLAGQIDPERYGIEVSDPENTRGFVVVEVPAIGRSVVVKTEDLKPYDPSGQQKLWPEAMSKTAKMTKREFVEQLKAVWPKADRHGVFDVPPSMLQSEYEYQDFREIIGLEGIDTADEFAEYVVSGTSKGLKILFEVGLDYLEQNSSEVFNIGWYILDDAYNTGLAEGEEKQAEILKGWLYGDFKKYADAFFFRLAAAVGGGSQDQITQWYVDNIMTVRQSDDDDIVLAMRRTSQIDIAVAANYYLQSVMAQLGIKSGYTDVPTPDEVAALVDKIIMEGIKIPDEIDDIAYEIHSVMDNYSSEFGLPTLRDIPEADAARYVWLYAVEPYKKQKVGGRSVRLDFSSHQRQIDQMAYDEARYQAAHRFTSDLGDIWEISTEDIGAFVEHISKMVLRGKRKEVLWGLEHTYDMIEDVDSSNDWYDVKELINQVINEGVFARVRGASILDEPRKTLDPGIFNLEGDAAAPKMWPDVRERLLRQLHDSGVGDAVKSVLFFGSSASYQYEPDSDFDISVIVDADKTELRGLQHDISNQISIDAHPVTYFFRTDDYPVDSSDAIYDVIADVWVRQPEKPSESARYDPEQSDTVEQAIEWAKRIDTEVGEFRRDVIDLDKLSEAYRNVDESRRHLLFDRVQQKISEINEDIAVLADESDELYRTRLKAFEEQLDGAGEQEARDYASRNWLPANVIYKVLERYRYTKMLKMMKQINEEGLFGEAAENQIKEAQKKPEDEVDIGDIVGVGINEDKVYITNRSEPGRYRYDQYQTTDKKKKNKQVDKSQLSYVDDNPDRLLPKQNNEIEQRTAQQDDREDFLPVRPMMVKVDGKGPNDPSIMVMFRPTVQRRGDAVVLTVTETYLVQDQHTVDEYVLPVDFALFSGGEVVEEKPVSGHSNEVFGFIKDEFGYSFDRLDGSLNKLSKSSAQKIEQYLDDVRQSFVAMFAEAPSADQLEQWYRDGKLKRIAKTESLSDEPFIFLVDRVYEFPADLSVGIEPKIEYVEGTDIKRFLVEVRFLIRETELFSRNEKEVVLLATIKEGALQYGEDGQGLQDDIYDFTNKLVRLLEDDFSHLYHLKHVYLSIHERYGEQINSFVQEAFNKFMESDAAPSAQQLEQWYREGRLKTMAASGGTGYADFREKSSSDSGKGLSGDTVSNPPEIDNKQEEQPEQEPIMPSKEYMRSYERTKKLLHGAPASIALKKIDAMARHVTAVCRKFAIDRSAQYSGDQYAAYQSVGNTVQPVKQQNVAGAPVGGVYTVDEEGQSDASADQEEREHLQRQQNQSVQEWQNRQLKQQTDMNDKTVDFQRQQVDRQNQQTVAARIEQAKLDMVFGSSTTPDNPADSNTSQLDGEADYRLEASPDKQHDRHDRRVMQHEEFSDDDLPTVTYPSQDGNVHPQP